MAPCRVLLLLIKTYRDIADLLRLRPRHADTASSTSRGAQIPSRPPFMPQWRSSPSGYTRGRCRLPDSDQRRYPWTIAHSHLLVSHFLSVPPAVGPAETSLLPQTRCTQSRWHIVRIEPDTYCDFSRTSTRPRRVLGWTILTYQPPLRI